ncbi:MAG: MoxR family ATPase [Magnetococcales bacterium]|nr:MoxR family ATPase [Magnetococcales bacterium]NGZ05519.1 MoxR family ATPase [Magnetococcales bacterium]
MPEQVHVFDAQSIEAVNAALAARRPLLVRGEPGTGKSQLAHAVAIQLKRAFISCVVDARTEPGDLMWRFDAVERLAEAQLAASLGLKPEQIGARLAVTRYLRPGPLWWAFDWDDAKGRANPGNSGMYAEPEEWQVADGTVLLIDEIDKAESDVPNSLLEALGIGRFTPSGMTEPIRMHKTSPLVVITTNEERALPDAFLRRCLVLFLELPADEAELVALLSARARRHFPQAKPEILKEAAIQLAQDRAEAKRNQWFPLPGQAEYLDLVRAVLALHPDDLRGQRRVLRQIGRYVLRKHPEARV